MKEIMALTDDYRLYSDMDGVWITGISENTYFSNIRILNSSIQGLLHSLPGFLADNLFEYKEDGIFASLESLERLESDPHDPLKNIFTWSPFILKIELLGNLGFSDAKFLPRFLSGNKNIPLKPIGIFSFRNKLIYRLTSRQAMTIKICEAFNSLSTQEKTKDEALRTLYKIKNMASNNPQIEVDKYLKSEIVLIPQDVSLGLLDDGEYLTVYPQIDGVQNNEIIEKFLPPQPIPNIYDIQNGNGRKRVILNPEIKKIFQEIKNNGHKLSGKKRELFYRNPRSILSEGDDINPDLINMMGFGPRVKGIGYPEFIRPIKHSHKEDWCNKNKILGVDCDFINGERQQIIFSDEVEAEDFLKQLQNSIDKNTSSFLWKNNSIPADNSLLNSCKATFSLDKKDQKKKILLIHTNEDSIDYKEDVKKNDAPWELEKPTYLLDKITLKKHQNEGIYWLQNLLHNDLTKGALLADEMGLGKTLQILTFLAWCIESELKKELGGDGPPYKPILIVAPLILVDIWKKEIEKYFKIDIFQPIEILHGTTLKKYKNDNLIIDHKESKINTLDINKIILNRLIITNYDTLKNYQYSLAKVPWSITVIDEAQEIKEPNTSITYALKALNPLFRIASTGTPVETSLTNLWSIMDFVQPGNPLGSLSEFQKFFSSTIPNDLYYGEKLRERLSFNKDYGLIKRRTKKEVLKDLPQKTIIIKECIFDDIQIQLYFNIIKSNQGNKNRALTILHKISMLTQHPFLITDTPLRGNYKDYIEASSKLRLLIDIIKKIREKNEKALIFTRSIAMQNILKIVLDNEFLLNIQIINGSTSTKETKTFYNRKTIIDSFSDTLGFNLLILSPEVAGVGITITAANHIIHYGRWWNPAKEHQATDRVYRIGQKKPVFVYHLIHKDPLGEFETFDEKLHRLLISRDELADNFLSQQDEEHEIQNNLTKSIIEDDIKIDIIKRKNLPIVDKFMVEQLSISEFEALGYLILLNRYKKIFLTPHNNNMGVSMIGFCDKNLFFIKCLHSNFYKTNTITDAITELKDGQKYYTDNILQDSTRSFSFNLVIVLNWKEDDEISRNTKKDQIQLFDLDQICLCLKNTSINIAEIRNVEENRCNNLKDFICSLNF